MKLLFGNDEDSMSFFKFVISNLHIAGGHAILDGFSERQQCALEGLLSAAQRPGPLGMLKMLSLSSMLIALIFLLSPIRRMDLPIRV
jgi:hypothetical protein